MNKEELNDLEKRVDDIEKRYEEVERQRLNLQKDFKTVQRNIMFKNWGMILLLVIIWNFFLFIPNFYQNISDKGMKALSTDPTYSFIVHLVLFGSLVVIYLIIDLAILDGNILKKHKVKTTLDYWTSSTVVTDNFINSLQTEGVFKSDSLTNMEKLESKILDHTDGDLNKLRLLKSYYQTLSTDNNKPVWIALMSFFLFIIAFSLQQIISEENLQVYGTELSPVYVITLGLFMVVIFYKHTLEKYKTLSLIKNTIEQIIERKDNE